MNEEPSVKIKLTIASFGSRALAYAIDSVIIGFVTAIIVQIAMGETIQLWMESYLAAVEEKNTPPMPPAAVLIFHLIIFAAYSIYSWTRRGATFGQRLLGLRVIQLKSAQLLSINQAALRFAVLYGVVSIAGPFAIVILGIPMLRSPTKRALHDMAGGSFVVNAKAAVNTAPEPEKPNNSNSREF